MAFESIQKGIKKTCLTKLDKMYDRLQMILAHYDHDVSKRSKEVLAGKLPVFPKNRNNPNRPKDPFSEQSCGEFSDYLNRIRDNILFTDAQGYSQEDRKKIELIIACSFLSVSCAQSKVDRQLPLDIYESEPYFAAQRGKELKLSSALDCDDKIKWDSDIGGSQHYGLIKGHMPIAQDDLAFSSTPFSFTKSSEQSFYDKKAQWVQDNFYHSVHSFSNSISGTMLCMLKGLCFLQSLNNNKTTFPMITDTIVDFDNYIKLFSSLIVCFSGGHSLHELIAVLRLPQIRDEFAVLSFCTHLEHLSRASFC